MSCIWLFYARKALDHVHYSKLFSILLYKKIPFVIIRFYQTPTVVNRSAIL